MKWLLVLFFVILVKASTETATTTGAAQQTTTETNTNTNTNNNNSAQQTADDDSAIEHEVQLRPEDTKFTQFLNGIYESTFPGSKKMLDFVVHNDKKPGYVGSYKVLAVEDIQKDDILFKYPLSETINAESIMQSLGPLGERLRELSYEEKSKKNPRVSDFECLFPDQIIKLGLAAMRTQAPQKFATFMEALPKQFDTPLFWKDEEIENLAGSPLYRSAYKSRATVKQEYETLVRHILEKNQDVFEATTFTKSAYQWAFAVYSSRMWFRSKTLYNPIVPIFEFFNYREQSQVSITEEENSLVFRAKVNIAKGSEVVINDDVLPNRDLLEFYGFVLLKNSADTWEVGLGLSKEDQLFGNKKLILEDRGLKDGQTYSLRYEETLPKNFIFALRVSHLTKLDFDLATNAEKDERVDWGNEYKVAKDLVHLCRSTFKNYKTTTAEDTAILKNPSTSRRARNAAVLRRSEKKIISKVLEISNELFTKLKNTYMERDLDVPNTKEMLQELEIA